MIRIILEEGSSLHELATIRYDTAFMMIPKWDMGDIASMAYPAKPTSKCSLFYLPSFPHVKLL